MIDYSELLSKPKCMVVAPAGYGKSFTISAALAHCENGKQLVLTHTHAGIASLLEKFKEGKIPSSKYHIETISGFAQKYVFSFADPKTIPNQEDEGFYLWIIQKAQVLFKLTPIKSILTSTYHGLFVDEYQDCSIEQHNLINLIATVLPTRILGDHLQGIFNFKGQPLVDMECSVAMTGYNDNVFTLDIPQRWMRGKNEALGNDLKSIRELLIGKQHISLKHFPAIQVHEISETDLFDPRTDYYKSFNKLLANDSLLVLHPETTSIHPRIFLNKKFNNRLVMLESIDDKDFYNFAKKFDSATPATIVTIVIELSLKLFNKTGINSWFNDKGVKNKTKPGEKIIVAPLTGLIDSISQDISFNAVSQILKIIATLPTVQCNRKELFQCLCRSLMNAEADEITVFDAMVLMRNSLRRNGRKVIGRCFGTTLLTKGLEFDTVVLLNAHKFSDPKHLYVAMTRASTNLILFSSSTTLHPQY